MVYGYIFLFLDSREYVKEKSYENTEKLLYIIMAVAVLAVPVFAYRLKMIFLLQSSPVSPDAISVPIRELVTKGNKTFITWKDELRTNGRDIMVISNILAQMEMLCRGGQSVNNVVCVF